MPRQRKRETNDLAPDGRRLYSLGDVVSHTGATKAQCENWVRKRVIIPDYPTSGTGNHRGFTFRNLVEFAVARWLAEVGHPLEATRGALNDLRSIDPEDAYIETPYMRQKLAQITLERPMTAEEGLAWIEAQEAKGGVGSGDYTDPQWYVEFEAATQALGWFEAEGPAMKTDFDERQDRVLASWQAFKNPTSRSSLSPVLCCAHLGGFMVFDPIELHQFITERPMVTAVSLALVFEMLEKSTGDHWNNIEAAQ